MSSINKHVLRLHFQEAFSISVGRLFIIVCACVYDSNRYHGFMNSKIKSSSMLVLNIGLYFVYTVFDDYCKLFSMEITFIFVNLWKLGYVVKTVFSMKFNIACYKIKL